jgi:hypothetical protein
VVCGGQCCRERYFASFTQLLLSGLQTLSDTAL